MEIFAPWDCFAIDWDNRKSLPEKSGIYFILSERAVFYVGMATSLRSRVCNHNKKYYFDRLFECKISFYLVLVRDLRAVESFYIDTLRPPMNGRGWQKRNALKRNCSLKKMLDFNHNTYLQARQDGKTKKDSIEYLLEDISIRHELSILLEDIYVRQFYALLKINYSHDWRLAA